MREPIRVPGDQSPPGAAVSRRHLGVVVAAAVANGGRGVSSSAVHERAPRGACHVRKRRVGGDAGIGDPRVGDVRGKPCGQGRSPPARAANRGPAVAARPRPTCCVSPGHRFIATGSRRGEGRRPASARCQCRDMSRATGPLMPKCVQSSDPVTTKIARATVNAQAERGRGAIDRPTPTWRLPSSTSGARARDGGHNRMPESLRQPIAHAVAPCLREGTARRSPGPLRRHRRRVHRRVRPRTIPVV